MPYVLAADAREVDLSIPNSIRDIKLEDSYVDPSIVKTRMR